MELAIVMAALLIGAASVFILALAWDPEEDYIDNFNWSDK